jgi:hypothetical protein
MVLAKLVLYFLVAAAQFVPYHAQRLPPAKKASHVRIIEPPQLESTRDNWAIVRWTSTNPGGADEHFAVAQYGTTPDHLDREARSHVRLNQNHPTTVFRVFLTGLKPQTTYYYKIDSIGGDGVDDGVKSPLAKFRTDNRVSETSVTRPPSSLKSTVVCVRVLNASIECL